MRMRARRAMRARRTVARARAPAVDRARRAVRADARDATRYDRQTVTMMDCDRRMDGWIAYGIGYAPVVGWMDDARYAVRQ